MMLKRTGLAALALLLMLAAAFPAAGSRESGGPAAQLWRLDLATGSGSPPGDDYVPGALKLTGPEGSGTVETPMALRLRGNTSRRFPKKSFRISLLDGDGRKRDLSLCGLREDDDWILNPLYSDTSKIREAMAYWLWEQINSRGRAAASSRMAYAEVWLNGEYRGLYGVQERVDRKQVDADRRSGLLYKVTANDRPTVEELLSAGDGEVCRGLELAFRGDGVPCPWAPAADYMALLDGRAPPGNARLDRENAVDYALWSMLTQARDNHFKNMYIHCAPGADGYILYRIPWDLDHTLGDLWTGDSPETNYVEYAVGEFAPDDAMKVLLAADPSLMDALRARWAELRSGPITEENLLARASALFDALYPAILRDTERWPGCGMGEGSAANIRDIGDYIRATLARMDGMMKF